MSDTRWLLYGAYGFTGELLVKEAVERGHRPTLAGRSREKLRPIAERFDLPFVDVSLDDPAKLRGAIEGHGLVLHAAGPFVHTSLPMLKACLDVGAHYLDITGEIPVFLQSFAHDREAREKQVAVISGVGFDVVPTDCLSRYVAEKLTDPRELEIAFAAIGQPSVGTMKSAIEGMGKGGAVRRDGHLIPWTIGKGAKQIPFSHRELTAVPIPWGDLVTAFHTTGIPNITTYMTMPKRQAQVMKVVGPAVPWVMKSKRVRSTLMRALDRREVRGPDETARSSGRSYVWAQAKNAKGESATAWLETVEGYAFTAASGIRAVEKTLELKPHGAITPARAFGSDFVLEVPGTLRLDALP